MGNVVSLGKERKARQKTNKAAKASENSVKFGRTKAQKSFEKSEREKAALHLNNHSLDKDV